jgi:hypothetical protein
MIGTKLSDFIYIRIKLDTELYFSTKIDSLIKKM